MEGKYNFDEIRPYDDSAVEAVIKNLCTVPYFINILGKLFPSTPTADVVARLLQIKSKYEFQHVFILPFLRELAKRCTDGVTVSGLDGLDPKGAYIFMSNHRDIVLDSAFLNVMLDDHDFQTTEIAIGSNLLIYEWIVDLVKLNKSFVVKRDLPVRQMMDASATLSAYIRQSIGERKQNIWIAQREGRSKDGNDQTQGSVLKMLNLSGAGAVEKNFEELNIVPVSITYEYDPCDALKAYQYQLKRDMPDYSKSKDEDLTHMTSGIFGRKGHVHFAFGRPINAELATIVGQPKNQQITSICEMVDRQIHSNYKIFPNSYIALDALSGNSANADHYTAADVESFNAYLDAQIAKLTDCDVAFVRQQMLTAYANPLVNQLKVRG